MYKSSAIAIALITTAAHAEQWTIDTSKSALAFEGKQSGKPFSGGFSRFGGDIDFSEQAPEKGKIHLTIDMASVTATDKDQSDALPTPEWFDIAKFPTAEFTSQTITRTGEHEYTAQGRLTIRGISQNASIPFRLTPEGTQTRATGSFTLSRKEYGVGTGQWSKDNWIAYPVTVRYTILATPK